MDKRLFSAVVLSLLVVFAWSKWIVKTQPATNTIVTSQNVTSASKEAVQLPVITKKERVLSLAQFKHDAVEQSFDQSRAAIHDVKFFAYQDYRFKLINSFDIVDDALVFHEVSRSANEIVFVHSDKDKKIIKRFNYDKSKYHIVLEINVQNVGDTPLSMSIPIALGNLSYAKDNDSGRYMDVAFSNEAKIIHVNGQRDYSVDTIKFAAVRDRYFCVIAQPSSPLKTSGFVRKIDAQQSAAGIQFSIDKLAAGQQVSYKVDAYIGPQDSTLISAINSDWTLIINYGTFNTISKLLLQALEFLFGHLHNWGVAIILLSILVYVILFPLTLKQMRSMKEMNALKPHIEELRVLHKDNPQKLNKEIMELYRVHKINPLGGCLPMILQIPIFFALYQALMRCVALKGAKFLWIKDLSEPDRLATLPMSIPLLGKDVNILPIIMAIAMFIQQKNTMSSSGGSAGEQEKMMLIIFPIMFGFIFYNMPAGLVLYWLVNSILMLAYQMRIQKAR